MTPTVNRPENCSSYSMRYRCTLDDIGRLLVSFALAAFLPLVIVIRHILQLSRGATGSRVVIGWTCLAIYGSVAFVNFYLSVIRPWLHQRRGKGSYEHVSGIPVVHSLFLLAAVLTLPPNIYSGILMVLLLGLDTGAAHWAAFAFARDFLQKRG